MLFSIFLILAAGCAKEVEVFRYVCPDGAVVSDSGKCLTAEKDAEKQGESYPVEIKNKANLDVKIIRTSVIKEYDSTKGDFIRLQVDAQNTQDYDGYLYVKASCLRRDEDGDVILNEVNYKEIGVIEKTWFIEGNEVAPFIAEGCFEKDVEKTDKVKVDEVYAYRYKY